MSLSIEQMRTQLYTLYPGVSWKAKVMSWPTNQVYAVYKNCVKYDTFNRRKKIEKEEKKHNKNKDSYYQYTIFDYI